MKAEIIAELEHKLSIVLLELTQTKSELRALQDRQRRATRLTTLFSLGGLLLVYPRSGKSPFPIPNYIEGSK